ncbi:MAG: hypothetical protein O6746_04925 [Thaumarchaeota archaeon]|nr:hypothetical protein [Nitrososphaerota archaeon]
MESTKDISRKKEMPSWGWFALIAYMVIVGFLSPPEIELWALSAGWFAIGAACLWNFSSCGRIHCSITGPGFVGLGIITLLQAAGLIELPGWVTWAAFAAIMVVGFGLEFRNKKVCGTCYRSSS